MKRALLAVAIWAAVSCVSASYANILGVTFRDDGDGAFVCNPWLWVGNGPAVSLNMYGDLYASPGHMMGFVTTSSALDPTLKIDNSIDNDATNVGAWAAFYVNLSMPVAFTISNVSFASPGNWSISNISQPAFTGSNYVGQVLYTGGTAIGIGESLDFGYWLQFAGATSYTVVQEFIPVAVPEPSTIALVTVPGFLVGCYTFAQRRRKLRTLQNDSESFGRRCLW